MRAASQPDETTVRADSRCPCLTMSKFDIKKFQFAADATEKRSQLVFCARNAETAERFDGAAGAAGRGTTRPERWR